MIDTEVIFRYRRPNRDKLTLHGFVFSEGKFVKDIPVNEDFYLRITVGERVSFKVYETAFDEEYVLINVEGAQGGFIGEMRAACEKILQETANDCFDEETFKTEQARRLTDYVMTKYGVALEFPWEDLFAAVLRHKENTKWFGLIMQVARNKLGLEENGDIEILNLKAPPAEVERLVDGERYFKAYHMNKTHWYTVCLDGRVEDEELFSLLDLSFEITKKGK